MRSFLFILFVMSQWAWADILFIDLNNVEPEIAVARQEAAKRGEKLILIPKDREAVKATKIELDKLRKSLEEVNDQIYPCSPRTSVRCQKFASTRQEIILKIEETEKKLFGKEALEKDLREVGTGLETVMISGHDGNGTFYGEFGTIESGDFLEVFSKSKLSENVRSLYLLGCNSVTQHTVGATWKAAFPKAQFIAGYEGTGYLRENGQGHNFIRGLMSQEKEILASKTAIEAFEKFKKFAPTNSQYGGGACFDSRSGSGPQYFSTAKNVNSPLADLLNCKEPQIAEFFKFLDCAAANKPSCTLPKQNPEVILRLLNKNNECGYNSKLTDEQFKTLTPFKEKLYFVSQLVNPDSTLSFNNIFRSADLKTRARLGLDGEITDLVDGLKKLLSLRRHYVAETHFSKIKDLNYVELRKLSEKRHSAEAAWLGISNLSMQQFDQYPFFWRAGEFRAEAFFQDLFSRQVQSTEAYDQRIAEVEKMRGAENEKKAEIEALRRLKKSHENLMRR